MPNSLRKSIPRKLAQLIDLIPADAFDAEDVILGFESTKPLGNKRRPVIEIRMVYEGASLAITDTGEILREDKQGLVDLKKIDRAQLLMIDARLDTMISFFTHHSR